ncbi:hypothetical protein MMC11_006598 [Xylographa trunciseda]|nr:hypothetical protein [Xylographa trunciseda]
MPSSAPSFGAFRLATPKDIKRIGLVATCGFFEGAVCAWYRPFTAQYPEDTLESYCQIFSDFIKSPQHAVLLAVDFYDPLEATEFRVNIFVGDETVMPTAGEEIVVGVAVWALEDGSDRIYPEISPSRNRDQHKEHTKTLGEKAHAAQEKYFNGISELEMLVVHPAYQGRGHGAALVRWGLELARMDGVKQGVIGPEKGMKLYKSLGFELLDELQWPGDDTTPGGLKLGVLRFDPSS